jgi:hypothetical protein
VADPVPQTEAERLKLLTDNLWNDSDLGSAVRKRAKELFPGLTTPDDYAAPLVAPLREENARLQAQLEAVTKRLDDDAAARAAARKEREDGDYAAKLRKVQQDYGFTEEGFQKVIARMQETKNYTDPEAAAAFIAAQTPPVQPNGPTVGPQYLNFVGGVDLDERRKQLHADPERYFDMEVTKCLNDPRGYVAAELGENYAKWHFGG